jgi:hypothetical protein
MIGFFDQLINEFLPSRLPGGTIGQPGNCQNGGNPKTCQGIKTEKGHPGLSKCHL